ncbi:MAG: NADPH-dependent F420 reductase [Nitrospiraceae bacterium]
MKIGIIGTGNVGGTLGRRWARKGHEVLLCSRSPESDRVKALVQEVGANAKAAGIKEGVAASEVVVVATPWQATLETLDRAGSFNGKIVIDCTNALKPDLSAPRLAADTSAAELVAAHAKGARVVKAFNTIPSSTMADPAFGSQKADLFLCGDDANAKSAVAKLGEDLGLDVVDTGPLHTARHLEYMASLWIYMAFRGGWGRDFTFKVLKR